MNKEIIETTNLSQAGRMAVAAMSLFTRGESFDTAGFAKLFIEAPVYQFGSFPLATNRAAIKSSADDFFTKIQAVYHDIKTLKEDGDTLLVEMDVQYWRNDGSLVVLPCADIFRMEGELFSELRIFMDVNPVFNPSIETYKTTSVYTLPYDKQLQPSGIMKDFYTKHTNGKKRIEDGYLPKWHTHGPNWNL